MRTLRLAAVLFAAALAGSSAPAQVNVHTDSGTETQERLKAHKTDLMWNLLGALGLLGLTGLWRSSDNDGYTSDPI